MLAAAAAVCAVLAGCGEESAADTTKRLPEGEPCDLITAEEVAQVLNTDAEDIEVESTDQIQCDYSSTSLLGGVNVIRGQDMSAMASDEKVDLSGIQGSRLEATDNTCGVSVQLDDKDARQKFSVIGSSIPHKMEQPPCEIADGVAVAILGKLPE